MAITISEDELLNMEPELLNRLQKSYRLDIKQVLTQTFQSGWVSILP